tara:strand:+ start:1268 stop:1519 length:252 start_codon:yes stop_codon:yes gene_type:complete
MEKVNKEELETIKVQQQKASEYLHQLGYLEAQKHMILHQVADLNQEIEEYKIMLEKEYGSININVEDGSYTKIEKEEKVVENA